MTKVRVDLDMRMPSEEELYAAMGRITPAQWDEVLDQVKESGVYEDAQDLCDRLSQWFLKHGMAADVQLAPIEGKPDTWLAFHARGFRLDLAPELTPEQARILGRAAGVYHEHDQPTHRKHQARIDDVARKLVADLADYGVDIASTPTTSRRKPATVGKWRGGPGRKKS